MKLLMTTDTVGGVWTYSIELARALARGGAEVTLAALGGLPSEAQRADAAIAGIELIASTWRLPWMDQPWEEVRRAGEWLLALAAARSPDLLHVNDPVYAALPWSAPVVAVGHSCVLSWWEAVRGESAPASWERYRRAMTAGLAAADAVVAPSAAMLRALERHYGVRGGTVIPNGRSPALFGARVKAPIVFGAGRLWDEAKNLAALRAVAPRLPWRVYVAGDSRHPDGGDASTDGVHALGRLDAAGLARWLARAPIYALPARYEPFGLGPLEAALSGCALVLGDIDSLRENWSDAALFVPPDDPRALGDVILRLIADPDARVSLAERARVRALRLTPERMAAAYREVYTSLLSRTAATVREATCAS